MKSWWLVSLLALACSTAEEAEAPNGADARTGGGGAGAPDARRDDPVEPSYDAQPFADARPALDAGPGRADAGACGENWIDLIVNGPFDDGPEPWTQYSALGEAIVRHEDELPLLAETPHKAAWLGGYHDALDQLYQQVTVPPNAMALRIRGAACFATEEPGVEDGGDAYDFLTVALLDSGEAPLEYLSFSNLDAGTTCTWQSFELAAVESHAGEQLYFYWEAVTDPDFGITNFFLDSLHFEALVPGC